MFDVTNKISTVIFICCLYFTILKCQEEVINITTSWSLGDISCSSSGYTSCTINCLTQYACGCSSSCSIHIYCANNPSIPCTINCSGYRACYYGNFYGQDTSLMTINVGNGEAVARNSKIYAPQNGGNLKVNILPNIQNLYDHVFKLAEIHTTSSIIPNNIHIICQGTGSGECDQIKVYAQYATGLVLIECINGGSCWDASIYSPNNNGQCYINCEYGTSTDLTEPICQSLRIDHRNSNNNLRIYCDTIIGNSACDTTLIKCSNGDCTMDPLVSNQWNCALTYGTVADCYQYGLPTYTPTYTPTFIPTIAPTNNPTYAPITSIPTSYPINAVQTTLQPTNNPTGAPTILPTTSTPTTFRPSPTTSYPTTVTPTISPSSVVNVNVPTTSQPTTHSPTTIMPSTRYPTTFNHISSTSKYFTTTQFKDTDGGSGEIGVDTTASGNKLNDNNTQSERDGSLMVFYIVVAMAICLCIVGIFILIKIKKKRKVKNGADTDVKHNEIKSQSPTSQNMSTFSTTNTNKIISEQPQYLRHLSSVVTGSDMIMDDVIDEMDENNHVTAGGPIQTFDINLNENLYGEGNDEENDEEIIEMCNMVTKGGENEINNNVNTAMSPLSVASLTPTKGNINIQPDEFIVEDNEHHTKGYIASKYNNDINDKEEYVTKGNEYEDTDIVDI